MHHGNWEGRKFQWTLGALSGTAGSNTTCTDLRAERVNNGTDVVNEILYCVVFHAEKTEWTENYNLTAAIKG